MHRVHTCPIELTEISQTYIAPSRHNRRASTSSSETLIVRDLFDANKSHATTQGQTEDTSVHISAQQLSRMSLYDDSVVSQEHETSCC